MVKQMIQCLECDAIYEYSPYMKHVCHLRQTLMEVINETLGYKVVDGMKIYHNATEPIDEEVNM